MTDVVAPPGPRRPPGGGVGHQGAGTPARRRPPRRSTARFGVRIALVLGIGAWETSAAQAVQAPTRGPAPVLSARDGRIAATFALGTLGVAPFDRPIAVASQRASLQQDAALRGTATVFRLLAEPGTYVLLGAAYAAGRFGGSDRIAEVGLRGLEAEAIALVVTGGTKLVAGRARPYLGKARPHDFALGRGLRGSAWMSFPSGHTTAGFATAAAVTSTVTRWAPGARWPVGVALYGAATFVGLSRIFDDRHWASDVVAGAGVGTVTGLVVARYHRTHTAKRLDRWLLGVSARRGATRWSLGPFVQAR